MDAVHPFSDLEGLRVAAEMERRGGLFYQKSARILKGGALEELLMKLAHEEQTHLSEFLRLYDLAVDLDQPDPLYDPADNAYLSALAAEIVFPGGLGDLVGAKDARDVLAHAMRSERDSIAFYDKMKDVARSRRARDSFALIAETERVHLAALSERLRLETEA